MNKLKTLRVVGSVFCGVWAFAFVLYFWHREGLVSLGWVFGSDNVRPASWAVLKSLFLPWHVWWSNAPWGWFAFSALMIMVYWGVGRLALDSLRLAFPKWAREFLALAVGMGISGVVFEAVAMAGMLGRWQVVVGWCVMFCVACAVRYNLRNSPPPHPVALRHPSHGGEFTGSPGERLLWWASWALAAAICALMIVHGVAYPETYWDSLILYMGYARKMFIAEAFPFKAVGQVGIGLGANYPHLVAVLSASSCKLAGAWNDAVCQLLPPVLSIGWIVFVYHTVHAMFRDRLVAISAALLVRSVPYGLCYSQFASDYAFAVFYTAAFLYVACLYVQQARPALLALAMFLAAIAMHINYLMGVLYVAGIALLVLAHVGTFDDARLKLGALLSRRWFWATVVVTVAIAMPWYVRNWVLTGNPVYAFFPGIFGGDRINLDVMNSAVVEWKLNGDGLARAGTTLGAKVAGSWEFFVTGPHHWKLQPLLLAFVVPGVVAWIAQAVMPCTRRSVATLFGGVAFVLFAVLVVYEYVVADYYLYQIIIILPLFGIFAAYWLRLSRRVLAVAVLCAALAPGLTMGLMGFKLKSVGTFAGQPYGQHLLTALRNPFIDRDVFMKMAYGGDMDMFARINKLPAGTAILTHENRHLLLNEELRIVHLDDWEMQEGYGKMDVERLQILDREGVEYYLHVPNEDKHTANSWLGMDALITDGHFEQVWSGASDGASTRDGLDYKSIPANANTLYRRKQQ